MHPAVAGAELRCDTVPGMGGNGVSGMRILLVEDDELLQRALAAALAEAGMELDVLGAAEPALDALSHGMHDLAIVDIGLPGMDGLAP